jgi:hypothetical protein
MTLPRRKPFYGDVTAFLKALGSTTPLSTVHLWEWEWAVVDAFSHTPQNEARNIGRKRALPGNP